MACRASTRSPVCSTKVNCASVRCIFCSFSMLSCARAGDDSAVARHSIASLDAVVMISSLGRRGLVPPLRGDCAGSPSDTDDRSSEGGFFLHKNHPEFSRQPHDEDTMEFGVVLVQEEAAFTGTTPNSRGSLMNSG